MGGEFNGVDEFSACLVSALDAEAEDGAGAEREVFAGARVVGMRGQAGVLDPCDRRMVVEEVCDLCRVLHVSAGADGKSLDALNEQEGVEGRKRSAYVPEQPGADFQNEGQPRSDRPRMPAERVPEVHSVIRLVRLGDFGELVRALPVEIAFFHHRAADGVAVSANHLCQRVNRDVGPVFERIKQGRGRHRIIHHERNLVLAGHFGDSLEVVHVPLRVAYGLGIEQAGVFIDALFEVGGDGGIDEPGVDAEPAEGRVEQRVSSAVQLVASDKVLPCGGDVGDCVEDGGLT